jgi:PAS domain S-box-containing protein
MNLQPENILKLFIKTAKFDFCTLLVYTNNRHFLYSYGSKQISNSTLFINFIDRFVFEMNFNVSAVDNDELFNVFLTEHKFNQYYLKEIINNDIKVFLFGFSKKIYKNTKILLNIRKDLENALSDYIIAKITALALEKNKEENEYLLLVKELINNSDDLVYFIKDNKFDFSFSLNSFYKLFDITKNDFSEEFTNSYFYSKLNADSLNKIKEFEENLKNTGSAYQELTIITELGIEKHISNFAIKINNSDVIIGIIRNITKEKNIEHRAEKAEIITKNISEISDNLVFYLNNSGYINFINDYGAITLGYVREDLIGKHLFEFIAESSKPETALAFQKALETDSRIVFGAKLLDRFKNNMDFEFNIKSVKYNNSVAGLIGIAIDVTDKIRSESQLRELNAKIFELNRLISIEKDRAKHQISLLEELNKLKNEFISNVSHEFRTPLASIVGFAETIDSDRTLPIDMIFEFNKIILDEGKRLAKLINDILDFSKLENGGESLVKEKNNLVSIIYDVYDSLYKSAQKKGITINKQIPDAEILINCDKERINKVFFNLLSNAIKFTKNDGFVSIIVQDFLKEVEVIISDTGIGISKEDIPKLFQKFNKIERSGSSLPGAGFGLPVVKQIIDLHKGLIRVESEVNKGTSFIVRLPKE